MGAFELRPYEHSPVFDPEGREKVVIWYELSW